MKAKYWIILSKNIKKIVFLWRVSPSRPAPAESPRLGTEQGCAVERCDGGSLPFFYFLFLSLKSYKVQSSKLSNFELYKLNPEL